MPRRLAKMASHLLSLAVGSLLLGCATPNSEPPTYYELSLNDGASVRPAIIEGNLDQTRRRGGLPAVLYEPETIDRVCAYVFSVDGQMIGDRADCTAAVPISPGTHVIAAWLQGERYDLGGGSRTLGLSTATLTLDAEEGHHYKISMDRLSSNAAYPRRVWITDVTTQTSVTEARLLTPKVRPSDGPWAVPGSLSSPGGDVAFEHDK